MAKSTPPTEKAAPAAAEAPGPILVFQLLAKGPIKVGGVIAYQGARLNLTQAKADTVNAAFPGALKLIGVP
jgi:hypothetical protein